MPHEEDIEQGLADGASAVAIAYADDAAGLVLGAYAAAEVALPVPPVPRTPALVEKRNDRCQRSLVVTHPWAHACARVSKHPELIVIGVAPGTADLRLLVASVEEVAGRLGAMT